MKVIIRPCLAASTAMSLICLSTPAWAGEDDVRTPAVGEIIVTANKRDESISKVGASIAAFDTAMLENRNIGNPQELVQTIPGMALAPSTHGTPVFTLRGIGYNADALGVYPAVSVSIDQAPMPFPVLAGHSMYDLERVEVLKGPQGTLFGQNSTGGAINYIAAKPTQDMQAGFDLDYGRFNEVHGTAYLSGPIGDTLGMRLAIDAAHRDAWQRNFLRGDKNGEQNYVAARLVTVWKPTDRLRFELNVNGSIDHSEPQALQIIASMPSNPAAPTFEELNAVLTPRKLRAANWSIVGRPQTAIQSATEAAEPRGNRKLFQAFLRADLDLTDDIALTSITTFNHLKQKMAFDLDGTQYELVDNPRDDGKISDFSQELRLSNASAPGAQFRWTIGANYNRSRVSEYQDITYGDNSLSNAGTNYIHISGVDNKGRMKSYAVFANGEYDVTDQITFKAAVRYTKSTNKNSMCNTDPTQDQNLSNLFMLLGELLGGQHVPLQAGDCYTLNAQSLPGDLFRYNLSEDNVSWRVGVDFKAAPDTLLYANVSRGTAGVVLANGSMSSQQSGEGEIRKAMIEGDVVDCMVALPGQLFYSTQIPACLWFLARDKSANGHRDRRGEILFIDARNLGHMVDRTRREFSEKDIETITGAYHRWRAKPDTGLGEYQDIPGFCKSATLEEVRKHGHVLTPGRYVGAEDAEDDGVPFAERFAALTATLEDQFNESDRLTALIREKLAMVVPDAD